MVWEELTNLGRSIVAIGLSITCFSSLLFALLLGAIADKRNWKSRGKK